MRNFSDGDEIYIEPFRAKAFPVVKDLVVDRSGLDRIQMAGGYVSVSTGAAPEANSTPVDKESSDEAFEAAEIAHLSLLPQGQPERMDRVSSMAAQMDAENFGGCTNHGECQEVCPKGISIKYITRMNRDFIRATVTRAVSLRGKMQAQ
jgi:succinate dehydrogenase / fumarate reductase iron-sulfur subunit